MDKLKKKHFLDLIVIERCSCKYWNFFNFRLLFLELIIALVLFQLADFKMTYRDRFKWSAKNSLDAQNLRKKYFLRSFIVWWKPRRTLGRIREQISENPRRSRWFSPVREFPIKVTSNFAFKIHFLATKTVKDFTLINILLGNLVFHNFRRCTNYKLCAISQNWVYSLRVFFSVCFVLFSGSRSVKMSDYE
mgnify:CR=1 FL=1